MGLVQSSSRSRLTPMVAGLLAFVMLAAADSSGPASAADFEDPTPRIAVVSAFAPEIEVLKRDLQDRSDHTANGVSFFTGRLEGKDVVLFLSGISVVNAAMTTQLALDHFAIRSIVFSGIAGGVDPSLGIGDVVIAQQWGQYLEMLFAREVADCQSGDIDEECAGPDDTGHGWATTPFFEYPYGNFGMMFPRSLTVQRAGADGAETRFWFPVDEVLLAAARRAASEVTLERCTADDRCLGRNPGIVTEGSGVSGGVFVDNAIFRAWVFETFGARLLDMESAAVAHVAYANQVPFVAVRSLADLAGGGDGANQMEIFLELAAGNAAAVVKAMLREMQDHH